MNDAKIVLLMFLKSGLSTDGETDRVLLVGPNAPATKRFTPEGTNTGYGSCRPQGGVAPEALQLTGLFGDIIGRLPCELCRSPVKRISLQTHRWISGATRINDTD